MKLRGLIPNSFTYVSVSDYIFPGMVCLFGCSKIGRPILRIYKLLTDTWMWKLEDRTLLFSFGNNEAAQFHFWKYINQNQTFILDSHRPFICSAAQRPMEKTWSKISWKNKREHILLWSVPPVSRTFFIHTAGRNKKNLLISIPSLCRKLLYERSRLLVILV